MKFEETLNKIINVIFLFAGNYIKGYRTIILNVITMILASWEFLSKGNGLFEFFCNLGETFESLSFFCDLTQTQFYTIAAMVVGACNVILRYLTVAPVGVSTTPAQVSVGYSSPTPGQGLVKVIVVICAAIAVIVLFLIVKGILVSFIDS